MDNSIKLFILALIIKFGCCGEAPYPPESNSLNSYSSTISTGHSPYNIKWIAQPPVDPETFSVQTGYEGYLIPSEPPFSVLDVFKTAGLVTLLPTLSKIGIKLAIKLGVWALGFLGLLLVGSVFTTLICAFTPLCTISFLGFRDFNQESVRSLINQERLNSATQFVTDAIKKYRELNKSGKKKDEKTEHNDKVESKHL